MWSVWASRLWSIGDSVVDSEMRLYDCRFILEVLSSGLRIPREFRFVSFSTCTEIHTYVQLRFANLRLFRFWVFLLCVMSCWYRYRNSSHHHVDDEETKSVEMKNRFFRARLLFLSIESTDLFFEQLFVCLQRLNCFWELVQSLSPRER